MVEAIQRNWSRILIIVAFVATYQRPVFYFVSRKSTARLFYLKSYKLTRIPVDVLDKF